MSLNVFHLKYFEHCVHGAYTVANFYRYYGVTDLIDMDVSEKVFFPLI